MFSKVALVVAMAAYASAQTSIPDYKSSLDMLKGLDVNSIDLGVRSMFPLIYFSFFSVDWLTHFSRGHVRQPNRHLRRPLQ